MHTVSRGWNAFLITFLVVPFFILPCVARSARGAAAPALPDPIDLAPLFPLAGQAGLPAYLQCDVHTFADDIGLHGGSVRTLDTNLQQKDFVFDLVFEFSNIHPKAKGFIGFGERENDNKLSGAVIGVYLQGVNHDDNSNDRQMAAQPFRYLQHIPTLKLPASRTHLIRVRKSGDVLTFSIDDDFDGAFKPDLIESASSIRESAPRLTRLNSGLFFGGGINFKSVRLSVNGVVVDPGAPADQGAKPVDGIDGFFRFSVQGAMPPYFKIGMRTVIGADGLAMASNSRIRTVDSDYLDKDFTFDVIYHFNSDDGNPLRVGIGEDGHDGGWLLNSIAAEVNGPARDGNFKVDMHRTYGQAISGKLGRDHAAGPNLLRVQKRGNTLTFALCAGYDGKFQPDITGTFPDLKHIAPYLTGKNSWLYLADGGVVDQVRLVVDGTAPATIAQARPSREPPFDAASVALAPLGGQQRLPACFRSTGEMVTHADGLSGGIIRTADAIPLDKDFTFNVLFRFDQPGAEFRAGLGNAEHEQFGPWMALVVKTSGPHMDETVSLLHNVDPPDWELGKLGDSFGPHLFRMQKRGNTLTVGFSTDYTQTFSPTLQRTFPDLKQLAPFLTDSISRLFVEGDNITVMGISASVDGKPLAAGEFGSVAFAPSPARHGGVTPATPGSSDINAAPTPSDSADRLSVNEHHEVAPGMAGTLLVLAGAKLQRLAPDGITLRQTLTLPNSYEWIAERSDYFVAMSDETKSLDLIDKTMHVMRSIPMDYYRRHDLCLNPSKPISYVTVEKATNEGFLHAILIVDETTGDVFEPTDFIGNWLQISPDGNTLYSAYRDIYEKGDRLLFNPDSIDVIPEYGDIDMLIEYDVSEKTPQFLRIQQEAGGNGQGLVLSPDGQRISYLSFVGYPVFSRNIAAWDPADLTKRPISYPAHKNKADCKHVAFHPTLMIAAAPAAGGAVCFNRETGQVEPERIPVGAVPDTTQVADIHFSPDGRSLILDCKDNGDFFLLRIRLKLTPAETANLRDPTQPRLQIPTDNPGVPGERT